VIPSGVDIGTTLKWQIHSVEDNTTNNYIPLIRPAKHEVFTIVPLLISLFHSISLPFPFNNFISTLLKSLLLLLFSFVFSSPISFSPSIQTILLH